jgi:hypothetical protein
MALSSDLREFLELLNANGVDYFVVGKKELIKNKRAVGRPQDLADLAELD